MIPRISLADNPCQDIINKCDAVIEKQEKLIITIHNRYMELADEHYRTLEQLSYFQTQLDSEKGKKTTYGLIGFGAGVALMLLVQGMK